MLKRLIGRTARSTPKASFDLEDYTPSFAKNLNGNGALNTRPDYTFKFQQDLVDELMSSSGRRTPSSDMLDLSSTVCAGICYWTGLGLLGSKPQKLVDFIEDIYSPKTGIKHTFGVDHIKFIKYLGKNYADFYGLTLNPFRKQDLDKFIEYGGYTGEGSKVFFKKNFRRIKGTSSAAGQILDAGGLAILSTNPGFNGYNTALHDILVVGKKVDAAGRLSFLIFDPDARAFYNTQKARPTELARLKARPGLFIVSQGFIDKNTFRKKPSPGGITVGLFTGPAN